MVLNRRLDLCQSAEGALRQVVHSQSDPRIGTNNGAEHIMKNRTVLFVMNTQTPDAQILESAETAARDDTHLLCLLIDAAPVLPMYAYVVSPYGSMNIPDDWGDTVKNARDALNARIDEIEALLAQNGASGEVQAVLCASTEAKHHVARLARVCDEAIFADSLRTAPDIMHEAASGVLFHSPIGVQINAAANQSYGCIFVAWDSSEAASAAIHAALPYLKEAKSIVVGCFDPVTTDDRDGQNPGSDVAAWLSRHGCKVTVSQFPSGGRPIGDCIQTFAAEAGADLVVMGAYGHARVVQTILGGTTRTMFEQTNLAVLLAH